MDGSCVYPQFRLPLHSQYFENGCFQNIESFFNAFLLPQLLRSFVQKLPICLQVLLRSYVYGAINDMKQTIFLHNVFSYDDIEKKAVSIAPVNVNLTQ